MIRGGYSSKHGGGNRLGNVWFLQADFEQKPIIDDPDFEQKVTKEDSRGCPVGSWPLDGRWPPSR